MSKRLAISMILLTGGLAFLPTLIAPAASLNSGGDESQQDKWNNAVPLAYVGKKPSGPTPRRDISGIWGAAGLAGIQATGALEHPAIFPGKRGAGEGGRPDETGIINPLPYTPLGLTALKANKPLEGVRQVPAELSNDPGQRCDPIGFPYMELYALRTIDLIQTPRKVLLLDELYGYWRNIWTDGRALPKDPPPRWNGYSVGKWVDDYTFVVETVGLNPKTWLDHAGRPHSDELQVEERFHRLDYDDMQLTVKITDPKMYTDPWLGLNNFPLHLLPPDFDIPELLCAPSEMEDYDKQISNPLAP